MLWFWVRRSTHEAVRRENYTLRDALREANEELRKHRVLVAGLRRGDVEMTRAIERVFEKSR